MHDAPPILLDLDLAVFANTYDFTIARQFSLEIPQQIKGDAEPNHSPRFTLDEDALLLGVRALAQLAVDALRAAP